MSEDFRFGNCYPISSRTSKDPGDLIWIEAPAALPPRAWRSARWVDERQGWHRATGWMPAPPPPEELSGFVLVHQERLGGQLGNRRWIPLADARRIEGQMIAVRHRLEREEIEISASLSAGEAGRRRKEPIRTKRAYAVAEWETYEAEDKQVSQWAPVDWWARSAWDYQWSEMFQEMRDHPERFECVELPA